MIIFNELRIVNERGCLVVDCEVEGVDVYKDMYIKSIYLEYYKNANAASMPSEKAMLVYENAKDDRTVRAKRVSVSEASLGNSPLGVTTFGGGLFYVVVKCEGDLPASVVNYPCTYDDATKIGAVLDWKTFYERGMQYVASLFGGCNPCPDYSGFEHFAVLWEALKMAIATCDWNLVSELWDKFLLAPDNASPLAPVAPRSGCGCR